MSDSEMTRPVSTDRLRDGQVERVEARPEECAAIARRLLVPSVEALACRWTLRPGRGGTVLAAGVLEARLHQECVVSLEPFPVEVHEAFNVRFVPAGKESEDADDPDAPDELPYEGAILDLGEATVEQLALSLDPYPRKPGAVLPEEAGAEQPGNPFAALAARARRE